MFIYEVRDLKSEVKSMIKVVSSNLLVMLIGIVQTFILPNILEPVEYGYWSLYGLYIGYAGFVIWGFCDGFYLKYGGKRYEDIDKKLFSGYHWILFCYLILLFLAWCLGIKLLLPYDKRSVILIFIGIGGILVCQNSYFILLNQATARFSIYAKGNVIEKIVVLIVSLGCILLPNVNCYYIICAALIGKILTTIYFAFCSRDIIFLKPQFDRMLWCSVVDNIRVGFTLTLSGVGAMLITGFGRFVVENKLGIEELGYYSLMFSISALFTQLIYAVSTVLYPTLRRVDEVKAKYLLGNLDQLIINFGGIILILYYPARYLLQFLFPKYQPAMSCILFLFPIVICQSRMTLVYNTIYKVLRWEKQLLNNAFISLIFCVISTFMLFNLKSNKESVALAAYMSFFFWNMCAIYYYRKKEGLRQRLINSDVILCIIYIITNYLLGYSIISFTVTLLTVLLTLLVKNKQTIKIIKEFREIM